MNLLKIGDESQSVSCDPSSSGQEYWALEATFFLLYELVQGRGHWLVDNMCHHPSCCLKLQTFVSRSENTKASLVYLFLMCDHIHVRSLFPDPQNYSYVSSKNLGFVLHSHVKLFYPIIQGIVHNLLPVKFHFI